MPFTGRAQNDACSLRISLLTCAPGEELYSTFGHTALRVKDEHAGTDEVFNYGTFEFSPDFNIKFIRGKLLYSLSVEDFADFMYAYRVESRSVQEQVLQLGCAEKQQLYLALQRNALPQDRDYRYDFLFDNCTTRAGDMVARNTQAPVQFANILPSKTPTFRDLIHSYLDAGHEHWSKLGIDLLLGAPLDRKVSNREAMFLPDYLLKGFDHATVGGHRLADPPQTILQMPSPLTENSFITPAVAFTALLVLILALSMVRSKGGRTALMIFDFIFFLVVGLAGLLLLFMWFGTDHQVCRNNYNLVWALPTNAVMAFFVHSKKQWPARYFRVVALLNAVLLLAWVLLPQKLNPALIPLILLLIHRSWSLSKLPAHARA
jgi:hypothetical protein